MGTRATIQRMTPDGPLGSYHNWDGYPTALGKTLWDLYHGHFQADLDRMLGVLIDEHPMWSSINEADWSLAPGYDRGSAPACYCHGGRSEKGSLLPLVAAAGSGCEWAYVFYPETSVMKVLSSYRGNGSKMIGMFGQGDPDAKWAVVAELPLGGPEPDWNALERGS